MHHAQWKWRRSVCVQPGSHESKERHRLDVLAVCLPKSIDQSTQVGIPTGRAGKRITQRVDIDGMDPGERVDQIVGMTAAFAGRGLVQDRLQRAAGDMIQHDAFRAQVITGPVVVTGAGHGDGTGVAQHAQQRVLAVSIGFHHRLARRWITAQHHGLGGAVGPLDVGAGHQPAVAADHRVVRDDCCGAVAVVMSEERCQSSRHHRRVVHRATLSHSVNK